MEKNKLAPSLKRSFFHVRARDMFAVWLSFSVLFGWLTANVARSLFVCRERTTFAIFTRLSLDIRWAWLAFPFLTSHYWDSEWNVNSSQRSTDRSLKIIAWLKLLGAPSSPQINGGIAVRSELTGGIAFRFAIMCTFQTSGSLVFEADDFLALPT